MSGAVQQTEISAARERIEDARTVLKDGEEIEAKFIGVDRKNRTITLSIKAKHLHLDEARAAVARAESALTRLTGQLAEARPAAQSARQRLHELQLEVVKDEESLARYQETAGRIAAALEEIAAYEELERARLSEAGEKFAAVGGGRRQDHARGGHREGSLLTQQGKTRIMPGLCPLRIA